ncbi:glucose dehydrogenase [FAD, quinone]-like [Neodiprion pinetum]|uniref:glucose dehydrogenase [FAD, quinone]-like n=1 Tax=Neodiprion pinetum TaxID=441929 RepID=UPI001EDDCA9A|nr:glucose dehydrogenase [FAD, quinone]-like [Neodiprion pinetum]XP_046473243.1 glucose dehydrogenase [FAD, quinone]-like [Neodiprion pinetum]
MAYNFTSRSTCNADFLGPSLADICSGSSFVLFMSLLNTFVRDKNKISGICERIKPIERPDPEYDFVVIGGGAAGSVVASRLSEISKWKVLLIEAGPDEPTAAEIPSFFIDDLISWGYQTTNESHACLSTNGSCSYSSVKTLGGNTVHNAMVYLRGNPTDYNNWAALGNEGWSWNEVKPFFLKAENNSEIHRVGRFWHATGGPLTVGRFPYQPPITYSILAAAKEAGFGVSHDLNGDDLTGFSIVQTTNKHGVRRSSARAYLWPARHRRNLHVSLNSTCTRIIIENGAAVGVEYYQNGEFKTVHTSREVILSAGSIKSPHVLLLSGVGPQNHLKSMGVEVVKNLPGVGENYHDHLYYQVTFTVNEADIYDNNWAAASEYLAFQTGPLSATGLNQVLGVISSPATMPDYPDTQIQCGGYLPTCAPGEIGALQSTGRRTVTFWSGWEHPKSRGRISLASKNPFQYPVIWGNFLDNSDDVAGLVRGINFILALAETKALKAHNLTLSNTPLEACSDHLFPSDEYWECAVHQNMLPQSHNVGSCKMGPPSDPMAVVDPQLRVYGIKGLRIADASIMPQVISANTAAATMMIGERAAHFIKTYWGGH